MTFEVELLAESYFMSQQNQMGQMKFSHEEKCHTGVAGLDEILRGGLPRNQLFLVQGEPGTGKTSLALQFLLQGARDGEKTLYITFSETKAELEAVAVSHGWDLSRISILELSAISKQVGAGNQTTLFHPSEMELSRTVDLLYKTISDEQPTRIVFDSVSRMPREPGNRSSEHWRSTPTTPPSAPTWSPVTDGFSGNARNP